MPTRKLLCLRVVEGRGGDPHDWGRERAGESRAERELPSPAELGVTGPNTQRAAVTSSAYAAHAPPDACPHINRAPFRRYVLQNYVFQAPRFFLILADPLNDEDAPPLRASLPHPRPHG